MPFSWTLLKLLIKETLVSYGIKGPVLECITDFLSKRTQKVLVGGQISESIAVLSGVPQGTVL